MINYKNFRKIVSIVIIIAFVFYFQSNILLHAQDQNVDEILDEFTRAKNDFSNDEFENLKKRIDRLFKHIIENKNGPFFNHKRKKEVLGQCYLLLGAIDEKEGDIDAAKKNYQTAIVKYDTETVYGIDLNNLPIHKRTLIEERFKKAKRNYLQGKFEHSEKILTALRLMLDINKKGDKELLGKVYILLGASNEKLFGTKPTGKQKKLLKHYYRKKARKILPPKSVKVSTKDGKVIAKEKCNPIEGIDLTDLTYFKKYYYKKKFPWPWVIGGAAVIGVVVYFLIKPKKKYTLTVTKGEGVNGDPDAGTTTHAEGSTINYSYSLQGGYSNLLVLLDGIEVPSAGTIEMNRDHTLRATADELNFDTDKVNFSIPEGSTGYFNVKLSVQPPSKIDVEVFRESGDEDITVVSGATFTFTTSNWNTYQTVTLHAAEDNDDRNSWAIVAITALEIPKETVTVIESDNDKDNALDISISN